MDLEFALVPPPDHIKNPRPEEILTSLKKPEGWWSLEGLHGTREGVLKAVDNSVIPDRWKAVLQAEIGALKPEFNFLKLDAHFHDQGGTLNLSLSIVPSKMLV